MNKSSNYSLYLAGLISESKYLEDSAPSYESPEFLAWLRKFEKDFPDELPPGLGRKDAHDLYVGRTIRVLDEMGMASRWSEYAGSPNLDEIIKNYDELLVQLVGRNFPAMLAAYKEYHGL